MRASIVSTSMPTSETRTYASITSPLSRMMSITSARPLGLGRSRYPPRGVAVATAIASLRSRSSLLLFALGWTRWARRGVHATASVRCVFVHVLTVVVVFLVEVRLVLRRFVAFFSLVIDVVFVVAVGLVLDVGLLLGVDALVVLRLVGLLVFVFVLVLGLVLVVEVVRRLVFDVEVVVVVTEPARLGEAIADPLGQIADARHVTDARDEARALLDSDASRSGERCARGDRLDPGPVLALVRNG